MDWTVIANPTATHQQQHQRALAKGLAAHGIPAVLASNWRSAATRYVACWSWRIGKRLRDLGHEVLVMERGYLGDRFAWTSLGWNGLNGRATVPRAPDDGGERFHRHFRLSPDNPAGDYVLLVGQVPRDASLQGRDLYPWYCEQAKTLATRYGLPVRFRPHPLARHGFRPVPGAQTLTSDLDAALAGAALVVTYNSNVGVDALVAGKRATAENEGSMIWGVTDREAWAHALAWRQWTIDEISNGSALDHVMRAAR